MIYKNIVEGKFISRPNRFVAEVEADGQKVMCHVKNTGRCKELLIPGATVFLEDFNGRMGTRKMRYSLIGVMKNTTLINMDSQAPNKAVHEALFDGRIILPGMKGNLMIKPETTCGGSRFDFYVEDENAQGAFVEVKGVTLEEDSVAMFPDAPTQRGVKHIEELSRCLNDGYLSFIIFVIQMKGVRYFTPNIKTHREFAEALKNSFDRGVTVLAYDCIIGKDFMEVDLPVPIFL